MTCRLWLVVSLLVEWSELSVVNTLRPLFNLKLLCTTIQFLDVLHFLVLWSKHHRSLVGALEEVFLYSFYSVKSLQVLFGEFELRLWSYLFDLA